MLHLLDALCDSLSFVLHAGETTEITKPHSTGWRVLPGTMCSQLQCGRDRMLVDGKTLPVPEGALMLLPAGVHHRVDLVSDQGRARWMHGLFTVLGSLDLFALVEAPPVIEPSPVAEQVGGIIESWHRQRPAQGLARAAADRAMGFQILAHLAPVLQPRPCMDQRLEWVRRLRPVLDQVEAHPDQTIPVASLAAKAGLPPRSFHRAFLAATGDTPARYLRQVRVRLAQRLLISSRLTVAEIAARCGFDNPFVFSRTFSRTCGLSPRAYRQATGDIARIPDGPALVP